MEEKPRSTQRIPLVLRSSQDLGYLAQRPQLPIEYNQQVLSPRTPEKSQPCSIRNSHHFYINSPSPTSAQITNPRPNLAYAPPPVTNNPHQIGNTLQPQMICSNNMPPVRNIIHFNPLTESIRSSTHVRPHSHNPYISKSNHKETNLNCQMEKEEVENCRSRAVSASANIKISLIANGCNG